MFNAGFPTNCRPENSPQRASTTTRRSSRRVDNKGSGRRIRAIIAIREGGENQRPSRVLRSKKAKSRALDAARHCGRVCESNVATGATQGTSSFVKKIAGLDLRYMHRLEFFPEGIQRRPDRVVASTSTYAMEPIMRLGRTNRAIVAIHEGPPRGENRECRMQEDKIEGARRCSPPRAGIHPNMVTGLLNRV